LTRPAEGPGTPLEPSGNRRPREMVTHDRIRLTGLLRKTPAHAGVFYDVLVPGEKIPRSRALTSGSSQHETSNACIRRSPDRSFLRDGEVTPRPEGERDETRSAGKGRRRVVTERRLLERLAAIAQARAASGEVAGAVVDVDREVRGPGVVDVGKHPVSTGRPAVMAFRYELPGAHWMRLCA